MFCLECDGDVLVVFAACLTGCKVGMCLTYGMCNSEQCDTDNNYGDASNGACVHKYIQHVLVTLVTSVDGQWVWVVMTLDILT